MSTGPLRGIRVLEFSQIVAGPLAGIILSDLGADVVKVEPLEGEARRNSGAVVPNEGKYFQSLNRGKRSLTVDLARPEGRAKGSLMSDGLNIRPDGALDLVSLGALVHRLDRTDARARRGRGLLSCRRDADRRRRHRLHEKLRRA